MKLERVKDVAAFLRAGRRVKRQHEMSGRVLHWPLCKGCGIVALKNEAARPLLAPGGLMLKYVLLLLLMACGDPRPRFVDYVPNPDLVTPAGIEVTSNGNVVSLVDIDRIVSEYETCAGVERLPHFEVLIPPGTMPDDGGWYVSPCTGNQIFPCGVQQSVCGPAVEGCPCRCAGAWVPYYDMVVVTPNLAALSHELVHVQLQAGGHTSPLFKKCEGIR